MISQRMDKCDTAYSTSRRLGTIESVEVNKVKVRLQRYSACVSCEHSDNCLGKGGKSIVVDVYKESSIMCDVGDEVEVEISDKSGMKAVCIGFLVPLLLVVVSVLATNIIGCQESQSVLVAFALLVLYCIVVYMLRNKLEHKFRIRLMHVVKK